MRFSASRIGTYISCNRKAGWQYVAGYQPPSMPAQEKGKRVHKILEDLKRHGMLPDRTEEEGAIAAEALPHVDDMTYEGDAGPVQLEGEFTIAGRHAWIGYKDISRPGHVRDYKTTKDFKWAKTPGELLSDPQAILYAYEHLSVHPELQEVTLTWLYLRTKKPYACKPVETIMSRRHAALGFEALERFADRMQAAEDAAPPATDIVGRHKYVLTMAYDRTRCGDYGGCPHRQHCTDISPFNDPNNPINERNNHMSLLDELSALAASEGTDALERPEAATAAIRAMVEGPGNAWRPPSELEMATPEEAKAIAAINPPKRGRGRPKKSPDTVPAPPMPDMTGQTGVVTASNVPELPAGAAVVIGPNGAVATTVAPPGAGGDLSAELAALLGDTPSPMRTEAIAETIANIPTPPAAALPELETVMADASPKKHSIQTLMVGCFPRRFDGGVAFVDFDQIIAKAKEIVTLPDYFAGYGYKTNGRMLEAIQRIIIAEKPETLVIFDPRTAEATLALSFLRANAAVIVESVTR